MAETSDSSRASSRLHSASRLCTRRASSRSANRVAPRRGRRVGRAEPRRSRHELEHGAAPQRLPKVVGAADEQRPHLVDGGDAAVSGRATSHPQGADRLYRTVACLRLSRRLARLRSAGRRDGVDRVGLAVAASQLAVRAIHLHDGHVLGVQEASESGSVATGPFDADTLDRTESPKPGEQRAVAGPGRRERPYPEPQRHAHRARRPRTGRGACRRRP